MKNFIKVSFFVFVVSIFLSNNVKAAGVPTNFDVLASRNSVSMSWDAPTDASGLVGYKIYEGGNLIKTVTSDVKSYTDVGRLSDKSYSYSVASYDTSGKISARTIEISDKTYHSSYPVTELVFTPQEVTLTGNPIYPYQKIGFPLGGSQNWQLSLESKWSNDSSKCEKNGIEYTFPTQGLEQNPSVILGRIVTYRSAPAGCVYNISWNSPLQNTKGNTITRIYPFSPSTKFVNGDKIKIIPFSANIYSLPNQNSVRIGQQNKDNQGTIYVQKTTSQFDNPKSGLETLAWGDSNNSDFVPYYVNGKTWWYVKFDSGLKGWVKEEDIIKASANSTTVTLPAVDSLKIFTNFTQSHFVLNWLAPGGGESVVGYKIYRDGIQIDSVASTPNPFMFDYLDRSVLKSDTEYKYEVAAYDGANNIGPKLAVYAKTGSEKCDGLDDQLYGGEMTNLRVKVTGANSTRIEWDARWIRSYGGNVNRSIVYRSDLKVPSSSSRYSGNFYSLDFIKSLEKIVSIPKYNTKDYSYDDINVKAGSEYQYFVAPINSRCLSYSVLESGNIKIPKVFSSDITIDSIKTNQTYAKGIGIDIFNKYKDSLWFEWEVLLAGNNVTKTVKSINIIASSGGQWSTSDKKYSALGANIGFREFIKNYGDMFDVGPNYGYKVYLYGVANSDKWRGGNIVITFTDGTQAEAEIPSEDKNSTVVPPPSAIPDPTASITADGLHDKTYITGNTPYTYAWSSTNADTYSSSFTSNDNAKCGSSNSWLANTANGSYTRPTVPTSLIGCIYTITYTVKNSKTGKSATDTAVVRIVAPTTTTNTTNTTTTAPSQPNDLDVLAVAKDQINMSWNAPQDKTNLAGYKVYRDGNLVKTLGVDSTSYQDTDLSPEKVYSYSVASYDTTGKISSRTAELKDKTFHSKYSLNTHVLTPQKIGMPVGSMNFPESKLRSGIYLENKWSNDSAKCEKGGNQYDLIGATAGWAYSRIIIYENNLAGCVYDYIYSGENFIVRIFNPSTSTKFKDGDEVKAVKDIAIYALPNQNSSVIGNAEKDKGLTVTVYKSNPRQDKQFGWVTVPYQNKSDTTPYFVNGTTWWYVMSPRLRGEIGSYSDEHMCYPVSDCGWVKEEDITKTSVPPIVPPTTLDPTASITADGLHDKTYIIGNTPYTYAWSSTNADTYSSSFTSNNATKCGFGNFVANTASGSYTRPTIPSTLTGCIYTVTYVAKNSKTGKSVSDTVILRIVAPAPNSTPTPAPISTPISNPVIQPNTTIKDTTAPSRPTNLVVTESTNQLNLSWTVSTDNVAVNGYKVYRNNVFVANTTNNTFNDTGLTPDTAYTYVVLAYDISGNNSSLSLPLYARTKPLNQTTTTVIPNPTATFTIDGVHDKTFVTGNSSYRYSWSSANADTYSSVMTVNDPGLCGSSGGTWIANNASGSFVTPIISSDVAGCNYSITYTVKNSKTGRTASDVVTIRIVAPASSNTTSNTTNTNTTNTNTTNTTNTTNQTTTTIPDPTASLTIDGLHDKTFVDNNSSVTYTYNWSSTNADTFSSGYTTNDPARCGSSNNWIAYNANGSYTASGNLHSVVGCTYTATYTAKNSKTGKSVSSTAITRIVAPTTTDTSGSGTDTNSGCIGSKCTQINYAPQSKSMFASAWQAVLSVFGLDSN